MILVGGRPFWFIGLAVFALTLFGVFYPAAASVGLTRAVVFAYLLIVLSRFFIPAVDVRLLSPLLLLAGVGLVFYVVIPAIAATSLGTATTWTNFQLKIAGYAGSHSELLMLNFCAVLLLAASLVREMKVPDTDRLLAVPRGGQAKIVGIVLGIAILSSALKFFDSGLTMLGGAGGLGGEVQWALPPVIFFCLAIALLVSRELGGWWFAGTVTIALACLALTTVGDLARMPLAFGGFACLMLIVTRRRNVLTTLSVVVIAFVVVALLGAAANSYRHVKPGQNLRAYLDHVELSLASKIAHRQGNSAWCLEQVRARHWDEDIELDYLAHVSGLVPRRLWPGKPSLSRGTKYAVEYCEASINPDRPHSEGLTLIAEPIMNGGKWGYLYGIGSIIAFCGLASALMFRFGSIGLAAGVSLLPWLTAVEQHVAFYIANGTKMVIVVLLLAGPLHLYLKHRDAG